MIIANELASGTDAQVMADLNAVLANIGSGKPLDAVMLRRIRERSERITDEIRQKHGEINVAVDLIRETRNEG
jgi:hypothetical protein